LEENIILGGPPKPSSPPPTLPASSTGAESDIIARLDRITSLLERLLGISAEILDHVQGQKGPEAKVKRKAEESEADGNLPKGVDISTLLDLPDHLRKPLMMIFKLGGRGTAAEVSEKIGISRPQASATLNSLVRLGFLTKKRQGREGRRGADAIFLVPEEKLQR
jgi:DNA-binding transcriptional ArsR family regulator